MRLSDFDFALPEDLIAVRPARPRSAARLLVVAPDRLIDAAVTDLPALLRPGDRLVLNDTRVLPARLTGVRLRPDASGGASGGAFGGAAEARIEATLLEPLPGGAWRALARPLRKLRAGDRIRFSDRLAATVAGRAEAAAILRFDVTGAAFEAALAEAGAMPLPPYIAARRPADAQDLEDYQTIWARRPGAVAAPTASLHFDAPLLAALAARGVGTTLVTLHVGAGTFLPVKADDPREHRMHGEWGELTEEAALAIAETRRGGGRILPVGTTALRLLETATLGCEVAPFRGVTDIFITPGFRFQASDGLMTNFHLPKSTLMMLVSALMGTERMRAAYAHAIARRYRFFSFGDASLLLPGGI